MLGAKFVLRVVMFLVSAGVLAAMLVMLWYGFSLLIRFTVDAIERSNSDFAIWFKNKFRNSEALPWLCRRGLHKWGKWNDFVTNSGERTIYQERRCLRCNYVQRR